MKKQLSALLMLAFLSASMFSYSCMSKNSSQEQGAQEISAKADTPTTDHDFDVDVSGPTPHIPPPQPPPPPDTSK